MTVLDPSELQASSLADLHAIASQLGVDGYRRLRKADLVAAIVARGGGDPSAAIEEPESPDSEPAEARSLEADASVAEPDAGGGEGEGEGEESRARTRRSRGRRGRGRDREAAVPDDREETGDVVAEDVPIAPAAEAAEERPSRSRRRGRAAAARDDSEDAAAGAEEEQVAPAVAASDDDGAARDADADSAPDDGAEVAIAAAELRESGVRIAAGEVELLGNGAAFLRVSPPEASDDDVYISAAQVRRCELVSGDRISGPVRAARRSERYPSLIRVDTINGAPAESIAEGVHYDDLPAEFPSDRLSLGDGADPTLRAIEWLTPLGLGSRCVIVGGARAGKTETLRRLAQALADQEDLDVSLVLAGVRPEEVAIWRDGPVRPAVAMSFAVPSEARDQAVERAAETARRIAARGGDAVLLLDTLDGLHPQVARRTLASARNITDGGSLTVIATAGQEIGGETTVIALDVKLTSSGRFPAVDLVASGTLAAHLLVGENGASAIAQARAAALDAGG